MNKFYKCNGYVTGTFDPPTIGHLEIIERAVKMFEKVYVVILINPEKTAKFSIDDRLNMLRAMTAKFEKVECDYFDGYAVDYVANHGGGILVRGVRNETDRLYEQEMAAYNLAHGVDTIFLTANEGLKNVSSTEAKIKLKNGDYEFLSDEVSEIVKHITNR
ncbi:MAG: pantetheine-phosphate adenylyltransferase [Christensenellales bacterium]